MKPTINVKPPRTRRPYVDDELLAPIKWIPYPSQSPSLETPLNGVFNELCNLYQIGANLHAFLYSDDEDDDERNDPLIVQELDRKLLAWESNLPEYARLVGDEAIPSPLLFDLQLAPYLIVAGNVLT